MPIRPLSTIPECAREQLDLRGWAVIASDGALLGTVAELIVDVEHGTPVYINIAPLEGEALTAFDECWVRVPFEHTALDEGYRRVVLRAVATLGLGSATAALAASRGVAF